MPMPDAVEQLRDTRELPPVRQRAFDEILARASSETDAADPHWIAGALRDCVRFGPDIERGDQALEALSLLHRRQVKGCPWANFRIGLICRKGEGNSVQDLASAERALRYAAEHPVEHAGYALAQLYLSNSLLDEDGSRRLTALQAEHRNFSGEASWDLYKHYFESDPAKALEVLLEAEATSNPPARGLVQLGDESVRAGSDDEAAQRYKRAIEKVKQENGSPNFASPAYLGLARLAIKQAETADLYAKPALYELAVERLQHIPDSRPEYLAARAWQGHIDLRMALHSEPEIAKLFYQSGIAHYEFAADGGYLPAIRELARAFRDIDSVRDEVAAERWKALYEQRSHKLLQPPVHRGGSTDAGSPRAFPVTAQESAAFLRWCQDRLLEGHLEQMIKDIGAARNAARAAHGRTHSFLKDPALHETAARAFAQMGRFGEAIALFRKAMTERDTAKNRGICLQGIASCYKMQYRLEEAVAMLEMAMKGNPHAGVATDLALTLTSLGREEEALECLERVLGPAPASVMEDNAPEKTRDTYAGIAWTWASRMNKLGKSSARTRRRLQYATGLLKETIEESGEDSQQLAWIYAQAMRTLGKGAMHQQPRDAIWAILNNAGNSRSLIAENLGGQFATQRMAASSVHALTEGITEAGAFHPLLLRTIINRMRREPSLIQDKPLLGQALARLAWRIIVAAYYANAADFLDLSNRLFSALLEIGDGSDRSAAEAWLSELFATDKFFAEHMLVQRQCDAAAAALAPILTARGDTVLQLLPDVVAQLSSHLSAPLSSRFVPTAYVGYDGDALKMSIQRLQTMINTGVYQLAVRLGKTGSARQTHDISTIPPGPGLTSADRAALTDYIVEHVLHPQNGRLAPLAAGANEWLVWVGLEDQDMRIDIDFRGVDLTDDEYKALRRKVAEPNTAPDRVIRSNILWNHQSRFAKAQFWIRLGGFPRVSQPLERYFCYIESETNRLRDFKTPNPNFFDDARTKFPGLCAFSNVPREEQILRWQEALRALCDSFHGYFLERLVSSDQVRTPVGLIHDIKSRVAALQKTGRVDVQQLGELRSQAAKLRDFAARSLRPELTGHAHRQKNLGTILGKLVQDAAFRQRIDYHQDMGDCLASIDESAVVALRELLLNAVEHSPVNSRVDVNCSVEAGKVVVTIFNRWLDQGRRRPTTNSGIGGQDAERRLWHDGAIVRSEHRPDGKFMSISYPAVSKAAS